MMMTMLSDATGESIETTRSVAHSSFLDTEIETDVCALGITEKSTPAEIMMDDTYSKQTHRASNASVGSNISEKKPANPKQPQQQLFDFVHIRYQRSGIQDGTRIFRLAFEQTKPGGWIEVVETSSMPSHPRSQLPKICTNNSKDTVPAARNCRDAKAMLQPQSRSTISSAETATWIKRQLLEAGFVDVEEKGQRKDATSTSAVGVCYKLAGVGRVIKTWCLGFLGLRWNCEASVDEKTSSPIHTSSRIFVIARRP